MRLDRTHPARLATVLLGVALSAAALHAQARSPNELVKVLQSGGYVLVMRHASSPQATSKDTANTDNTKFERQLDEAGRRGAAALGEAVRALRIPIGLVLSSPTYRTMETVRRAGLGPANAVTELGDGGQGMQGISEAQVGWLRTKVTEVPRSGNTLLVTHQPNLARAFPDAASAMAEGEMLVILPDGQGGMNVIGRIPIDAWPKLR